MLGAVGDGEQMGKHHLCHTLGAIGWHVGDNDASLAGCLDIDNVIPRSQYPDILETWQLGYLLSANDDFIGQHHIGIGSSCHRFLRACAVIDRQLP